ncbi:MAG: aminoacyl-tRNA hydrolase [Pelagibacterales bacterium]|nr:aminoacyl-tRNA hydrolase [Pelagibacterales bacterium]
MYLLVGLGNIGKEYEITRHNFGFLLIDQIIADYGFSLLSAKKFNSEVFSGEILGKKVIALKPKTFMNRSGIAVFEAANFYKIDVRNILVLHDEVDLELGKVKVKIGGGSAGHNGLKSIDSAIGKDYMRLRLGVGRPANKEYSTADYVLGKFSSDELAKIDKINEKISDLIEELFEGKMEDFMNKFYR